MHDKRYAQGLVKYKNLKNHVKKMETGKFGAKPEGEYIDEECAICLEPLGNAVDVVNTTCKHRFHTFCLIESLGEGFCSSCPMCRNGVEKIVPSGVEGAQMRLLAKLRINIDQAEATHKAVYDELQKSAMACIADMDQVNNKKAKRLTYTGHKKKDLERRASQIKDQLQLLEEYDRVNVMGFSKICGKVGRKLSQNLGDTLQGKYVNEKGYYKDFVGQSSLRRLSQTLDKGLEQLRAPNKWSDRVWRRGSMDSNLKTPKKRSHKRGSMEIVSNDLPEADLSGAEAEAEAEASSVSDEVQDISADYAVAPAPASRDWVGEMAPRDLVSEMTGMAVTAGGEAEAGGEGDLVVGYPADAAPGTVEAVA